MLYSRGFKVLLFFLFLDVFVLCLLIENLIIRLSWKEMRASELAPTHL